MVDLNGFKIGVVVGDIIYTVVMVAIRVVGIIILIADIGEIVYSKVLIVRSIVYTVIYFVVCFIVEKIAVDVVGNVVVVVVHVMIIVAPDVLGV